MSESLLLILAFIVACGVTLLLTPLAIALARRTNFYDHPAGYKGHLRSTPYLGGVAVVAGLLVSSALLARGAPEFLPVAMGALACLGLGAIDDRYGLGPFTRLVIEVGLAAALFAAGVGWSIFANDAFNLAFSIVFLVGVVNAYNLMDNMDGSASTVAAVSASGLGVLAAAQGHAELGAIALALSGACVGFLRFNLASPSRIFLGDGGSVPIGFVVAATIMALPEPPHLGWTLVPLAAVMVGLPALDTTLVVVSRLRRGAGVFTGARDHITHRLRARLGSVRHVALALAVAQAIICGASIALFESDQRAIVLAGSAALIGGGIVVVVLLELQGGVPAESEEFVRSRSSSWR